MQEPYIVLIDMGTIWRKAIPSTEDRQMQDGTPYKWLDYVHKLSSIILARHGNAERIICVNDPYDAAYSTKDDERDLRVHVLRESGYTGPVVIDAADMDVYVATAFISQQLPGMLSIKRKQATIICSDQVTDEMASCIVQLHCMTGCNANSSYYGKGKILVYDQVMNSPMVQRQLSRCGDSLDLDEEMVEDLFEFTRHVIYGDHKSKTMRKRSFIRLPLDAVRLCQHCLHEKYLAYLVRHPSLKHTPRTWLGTGGWSLLACLPHSTCSSKASTRTKPS
ncbi:hypothetical protein SK128_003533 [Halocaridina rubra]|uniref:Uncharacterized protein n=1 Tax=Halocaridina rubra TaxID=373956 RepID=A0AAN8WXY2_HALRR